MLLRLQRDNPEWNVSMAPYWDSLPPLGASLTKHTYPHDRLDLLQDKLLVRTPPLAPPKSAAPAATCLLHLHGPLQDAHIMTPLPHVPHLPTEPMHAWRCRPILIST